MRYQRWWAKNSSLLARRDSARVNLVVGSWPVFGAHFPRSAANDGPPLGLTLDLPPIGLASFSRDQLCASQPASSSPEPLRDAPPASRPAARSVGRSASQSVSQLAGLGAGCRRSGCARCLPGRLTRQVGIATKFRQPLNAARMERRAPGDPSRICAARGSNRPSGGQGNFSFARSLAAARF